MILSHNGLPSTTMLDRGWYAGDTSLNSLSESKFWAPHTNRQKGSTNDFILRYEVGSHVLQPIGQKHLNKHLRLIAAGIAYKLMTIHPNPGPFLNAMQWNCGSISKLEKQAALTNYLKQHDIHVCLISETKLAKDRHLKLAGFNCILRNREKQRSEWWRRCDHKGGYQLL